MVEIVSDKFKLRPFKDEDAHAFSVGINTKQIDRDTTIPLPWDYDSVRWWIGYITDAATRKPMPELHFVIEIDGRLAGSIGIINIDGHKAEIGYWLKEEHAGSGIMTKVVELISNHAFKKMNLKRLFAPVITHNKGSARVLEKNGFEKEGTLRKYYLKHGKLVDAYCYSKVV